MFKELVHMLVMTINKCLLNFLMSFRESLVYQKVVDSKLPIHFIGGFNCPVCRNSP